MVWEIHARQGGRHGGDHMTRVKARWMSLDSIDDVSLECGLGVRALGPDTCVRREMNAFTKAFDVVLRWDSDIENPEVVLTWSDRGETCQERVPLTGSVEHHTLSSGLRRILHRRGHVDARRPTAAASGFDDATGC